MNTLLKLMNSMMILPMRKCKKQPNVYESSDLPGVIVIYGQYWINTGQVHSKFIKRGLKFIEGQTIYNRLVEEHNKHSFWSRSYWNERKANIQ